MLSKFDDKTAHYTCAIVLVNKEENIEKYFERKCYGTIISPIEGPYGFGYDPIFVPDGETEPFSRILDERKNEISHRGIASKLLMKYLEEYLK
jgi:XTP/dITP diphosphohydrolase